MSDARQVLIRRAGPADLIAIDRLHKASIRELCSSSYTGEQIRDWTSALKPGGYLHAMEVCDFMVAMDDGIAGLCIFNAERAEISALYISPASTGKGIGRAFIQEVEAMAGEAGIGELHLKSTLNAVGFYERMGFTPSGLTKFVLPGGTELPCVAMTKRMRPGRTLPQ